MRHLRERAIPIAVAASLVAGCVAGHGNEIADQIRAAHSPIVEEVVLSPINPFEGKDYDDVTVYLVAGTTDAQVQALWCDVVVPARPERLGKGELWFDIGVTRWPEPGGLYAISGGRLVWARDLPGCP